METTNCTEHVWGDTFWVFQAHENSQKQNLQACRKCGVLRMPHPTFKEPEPDVITPPAEPPRRPL